MSSEQQSHALLQRLSSQQQQAYLQLTPERKRAFLHSLVQQQQQQEQQQQEAHAWYRVFKPEIDSAAPDPLDPVKRYHDGLWVEHDPVHGKGEFFHVTGDIIAARGMRFDQKDSWTPGQSGRLHNLTHIGYVHKTDYDSGRIAASLRALPTPPKQQGLNFWQKNPVTGRHDIIWTKENGEPYAAGEQQRPIFKCNEWTALHAIPALQRAGILRTTV